MLAFKWYKLDGETYETWWGDRKREVEFDEIIALALFSLTENFHGSIRVVLIPEHESCYSVKSRYGLVTLRGTP
jgi:hypothetical protein